MAAAVAETAEENRGGHVSETAAAVVLTTGVTNTIMARITTKDN